MDNSAGRNDGQYNKGKKAELLAPAGTYDSLRAAVNAGADAVYLGGRMFGARAFAGNFDEEELIRGIDAAHLSGRRVYLTVNTLLRDEELEQVVSYIKPYYEAGLDAAIVQDFGVLSLLRQEFPKLELHASTQMTVTGRYGARLLKAMGASRVVTARELSAAEIKDIHDHVDVELESFVHGALCYSYSGQCLLSSMIGGRSGNRGRCAQPCRLTYSCNGQGPKHFLSPKDMCMLEGIPDILEAGVFSLKIEGRMKSPEYVAGVVSAYRRYVDMYLEKGRESYRVDPEDIKMLMDIYNRGGFCKGYYYEHNDRDMMTFDRPNHRGIAVGTVKNDRIFLKERIHPRDVLELAPGAEFTQAEEKGPGETIKIPFVKGYKPEQGREVYRTKNDTLLKELHGEYVEKDKKLPVGMQACFMAGEAARLRIFLKDSGISGEAEAGELEASQTHPAAPEEVVKQLIKLGQTEFVCQKEDIELTLGEAVFVPVKLLNRLRREAAEQLKQKALEKCRREYEETKIRQRAAGEPGEECKKQTADPYTAVQVMNERQLRVILQDYARQVSGIYISTEQQGIHGAVSMCLAARGGAGGYKGPVYLVLPYIFRQSAAALFDRHWEGILNAGFDGFVVRSPEELEYLKEKGYTEEFPGRLIADYNMYSYNQAAMEEWGRLGIRRFTLPEELNAGQLRRLCRGAGEFEKIVYGHLPLMVTAGCTLAYTSKKKPCGHPGVYYIADRMKKNMPAVNCCSYCYNLIYNYAPEYLLDRIGELRDMGVQGVRLMFTVEDENDVRRVMDQWQQPGNAFPADYTRGHYNRGVD